MAKGDLVKNNRVMQTMKPRNSTLLVRNKQLIVVVVGLIALATCRESFASLLIQNQPPLRYIRPGDLNIGGIISGLSYSADSLCGRSLYINNSFHFSEAIRFAVDEVNRNETLLPNVTLGYMILDDCSKESTAAIQAISFLPSPVNGTCSLNSYEVESTEGDVLPTYDVVGVIGCLRSSSSAVAAMILGQGQVPLVSYSSTSVSLNNKELYPYFMRVVPSDASLVDVHLELVRDFDWRYISVVYSEGGFGESAFQALRQKLAAEEKVCIAVSRKIYQKSVYEDYLLIMKDLIANKEARVLVVYSDPSTAVNLLRATSELEASGWFIWLVSDSWKVALEQTTDKEVLRAAAGCLVTGFASELLGSYNNYLLQMNVSENTNPWFARLWLDTFKCPLTDSACVEANKIASLPGLTTFNYASNAYEAVLTYAHGIQNVLSSKCPNKTGTEIRDCITGPDLLKSMKSLSISGPIGPIEFDAMGSAVARVCVEQIIPADDYETFNITPIAFFYSGDSKMRYVRNVSFDYHKQDGSLDGAPSSICSDPCGPGQFMIPKELACCWECRTCRNNEILVNDFTDCFICPLYQWPDPQTNFTICEPIPPDYPQFDQPVVVLCLVLAGLCVVGVLLVACAFYRYRSLPIIKASGRELSTLQLVSTFLGYITVPVFTMKPSTDVCFSSFFIYCLSFTGLYAPLLVKSIRIHRIFSSGAKSNAKMKYISPRSQIGFTLLLLSVQVFLCIIAACVYQPLPVLTQPVRTEKYVELSCDWTLPGHVSFLVYNIILVILCSVFAFKTRKLPDNFNESKFINLCVYTSLVIRLAFIPVYFTSERESVKTTLLVITLLINHTVVVLFLYLPKIYAAFNQIPTTTSSSCSVGSSNRRCSVVSATHNSRFLYGLSEVLAALRMTAEKAGPEHEPVAGSVECLTSTLSSRRETKLTLNKVGPAKHQEQEGAEDTSEA